MPGKKLLVADDSLTIQKVIRLALSNEGYEIQAVADGNDAISQILLFRPDVVLIDVSLPSKNAFEVKREVNGHEDLRETCFVLISSAFEKVDELQVKEVEFHGRLTKPFDPAHLRKVLSTVLAQVTEKGMEPTSFPQMPPPLPGLEYTSDEDEAPPNLPPPPPMSDSTGETDIQHLTESTMRNSGMEDYQWSMNEPSMGPPPLMLEPETENFTYTDDLVASLPPPFPPLENTLSSDLPPLDPPHFDSETGTDGHIPSSYYSDPDSTPPVLASEEKIDAMIHNQIEATLERMIEKLLPQIAEKLIKEEIHRLLSE